jgi:hypothetical protein
MDLTHVVKHVDGPIGEVLGLATEFAKRIALPMHTLEIAHELQIIR